MSPLYLNLSSQLSATLWLPHVQSIWELPMVLRLITGYSFMLNGRRIRIRASLSPDVDETMPGADWMGEHGCQWDFKNSTITIDDSAPISLSKRHTLRCGRAVVQEDTMLPP